MTDNRTTELDSLIKSARDMARNIFGCLGRCLYRRKDRAEMQRIGDMLMMLANELDARAERGSGTLTAEQVREAVMSADRWEKPMGNTGMTNTHLIIRDDGWQAIADELNAELGGGECARCAEDMGRYADSLCDPLKERIAELLRCLENDWHIHASWDGLRKFWCIELTEEGVRMRDAHDEALRRIAALEELVWFMVPFFGSACSHECGCPDDYFEPHGCDDGCKALKELNERMKELGIEVDE